MLSSGVVSKELALYDGTQTVTGANSTVITPTDAGFRASHATYVKARILFSQGFAYQNYDFLVAVLRVPNMNGAQYLEMRLSSDPADPTAIIDRAGPQSAWITSTVNWTTDQTDVTQSEFQTVIFPTANFTAPGNLSAAQKCNIRSLQLSLENGVRPGPAYVEVKSMKLVKLRPIVTVGFDDAFASDYVTNFAALIASGANIPLYSAVPARGIELGFGPGSGGFLNKAPAGATMTIPQMQEMRDSGLWTFVNHTYQHPALAVGKGYENSNVAETNSLSATPPGDVTNYDSPNFSYSACGVGGTIPAPVRSAVEYEINTCRDRLTTWGLNVNNSGSFFVSPYGNYNSDVQRLLRENDFIAHRLAYTENGDAFDVPGTGPFNMCGRLALNLTSLDARVQEGILKGHGMFSPFCHATGPTELLPFTNILRKWRDQEDAGLVKFVSPTEYASIVTMFNGTMSV